MAQQTTACHPYELVNPDHPDMIPLLSSPEAIYAQKPHIKGLIAGAMVTRRDRGALQTLIVRRAASDSYPLLWELPGGCAEVGIDKSLVETAVRELHEETGLRACRVIRPVVGSDPAPASQQASDTANWSPMGESLEVEEHGIYTGKFSQIESVLRFIEDDQHNPWGIATFLVEVKNCSPVSIDPKEHVEWAWVNQQEVEDCALSSEGQRKPLSFASEAMQRTILMGFRLSTP